MKEAALDERVKQRGREVLEEAQPQKLAEFRRFVLTNVVRFWDDSKDIKITVAEKLAELGRRQDLIGWVRGDQAADMPAISQELARLSKENAELRSRLEGQDQEGRILGLTYDEWVEELAARNLVDALQSFRESLEHREDVTDENIHELKGFGLVKFDGHWREWFLTEAGQVLCNRIALNLDETE